MQVYLGQLLNVTAIDTQGMPETDSSSDAGGYVARYKISYTAEDNTNYINYIENGDEAKVKLLDKM